MKLLIFALFIAVEFVSPLAIKDIFKGTKSIAAGHVEIDFHHRVKRSPYAYPQPRPVPKGGGQTVKSSNTNYDYVPPEFKVGTIGVAFSIVAALILLGIIIVVLYCYWKR